MLSAEGVAFETPTNPPVPQTVKGLTAFGHALYGQVARPGENVVISPLSIAYAYGLARAGAGATTAGELDRVFGFPAEGPHAAFNALSRQLVTVGGPPPKTTGTPTPDPEGTAEPQAPVVGIANGLFAQQGLPVREEFLRTAKAQYDAGVHTVDFAGGGATATIDRWVSDQTAGRITKLFDRLDPATKLVLANAVYFKGEWAQPFSEQTPRPGPFTLADGSTTKVPMMSKTAALRYAEGPGWQAVELPYAKSDLAMWVLVPQAGGEPGDLLAPEVLGRVGGGLAETRLTLSMPRWDFGTDVDLLAPMGRLGLRSADFSGIADGARLAQAVHRANITVDEWGTEAAAVTGLAFPVSAMMPPELKVTADHPFAFAIVHKGTSTPLFVGQVAEPKG